MTQIKIVLVGSNSIARQRVARYLMYEGFTRMHMLEGAKRAFKLFYGPSFRTNTVAPQKKVDLYDAVYKVLPDAFLEYLNYRVIRSGKNIVVPDARYVDEVTYLHDELGFCIVRVTSDYKMVRPGNAVRDAGPGTTVLYESFLPSFNAASYMYTPYYSVPWYGDKEKDRTRAAVKQMIDTLNLGWK